jgi:hypothetical protein
MNNQIVYNLYYAFAERGFSVLRFNFRGVGRSQGSFDHGQGELSDAAAALDWVQAINPEARACWIAGISFGAWIGMQLLMIYFYCTSGQSLRFFFPRTLPLFRTFCAWRSGSSGSAEGSHGSHRKAQNSERHFDRTCGYSRRKSFF